MKLISSLFDWAFRLAGLFLILIAVVMIIGGSTNIDTTAGHKHTYKACLSCHPHIKSKEA